MRLMIDCVCAVGVGAGCYVVNISVSTFHRQGCLAWSKFNFFPPMWIQSSATPITSKSLNIQGPLNKFADLFEQAFKIVIDS